MKKQSKAQFVRSLPADAPASEVIEKAKAAGYKLSAGYVYVIRSKDRQKGVKKAPAKALGSPGRPKRTVEHDFVLSALEMGLGRAKQLLEAIPGMMR